MSNRVTTNKVRFAFCNLDEPVTINGGKEAKYSLLIYFPKDDKENINLLNEAIEAAYDTDDGQHLTKGGKSPKPDLKSVPIPVRDGDEDSEIEFLKGCYFINATSRFKPECVNVAIEKIEPSEVYAGCYGRVSLNFYTYAAAGRRGIGCSLCNVQKLEDGEPLGGRKTARDDFA